MTVQTALSIGFPPILGWMVLLSMALSAIGFYRFVYFISIGYGLSVAGISLLLLIAERTHLGIVSGLLLLLLAAYGLRLSGYLLVRELRSATYRKILERETQHKKPLPLLIQILIWVSVSLLYAAQTAPVAYLLEHRAQHPDSGQALLSIIGLVVAAFGLGLESLADSQKSAAKRKSPERWVQTGLFEVVRCPNYLGEVLFWLGIYLSGIPAYASWWAWCVSTTGLLLIWYVMLSGAKRLERGQEKRYGVQPEYRCYAERTPILLPLVPWYSMKGWTFLGDV